MSTITKEFTKEQLIARINQVTAINKYPIRKDPDADGLAMDNELFAIALASLEAEPVAMRWRYLPDGIHGMGEWNYRDQGYIDTLNAYHLSRQKELLYTVPPAPVSLPDEIYAELYQLREEVKGPDGFNTWRDAATAEKVLRLSMERDAFRYRFLRDKDAFGDENEPGLASWDDLAEMEYNEFDAAVDARMSDSDMPRYSITQGQMVENDVAASEKKAQNERYNQISDIDYLGAMGAFHSDEWHKMGPITGYMHGWNARHAAMLQGAKPVTTAYKLSFEQWLSQQTGTIDVECGCVMTEVFFHWLRVAYEAGNSPQCLEISNSSTKNFRENAETSTKCWCHACRPVTFSDSRFVVCPECGNKRCPHANDHRNACTGSNEPGQEGSAHPAAPQQEVKP